MLEILAFLLFVLVILIAVFVCLLVIFSIADLNAFIRRQKNIRQDEWWCKDE